MLSLVKISPAVLEKMFLNLVYVFSLFHYYLPIEKSGALHLNKIKFSSPKDEWCKVFLKLAKCAGEEVFFHFLNVFSIFCNYLLMEKDRTLHWNKHQSPLPKDALCQVWLKLAQWFWRRRIFLILSMYLCYCVIICPL